MWVILGLKLIQKQVILTHSPQTLQSVYNMNFMTIFMSIWNIKTQKTN